MSDPVTPPPLQVPTPREKKYDRQLRLWAAAGQSALEDAHVLLINSGTGVAGIETLKNLVLPGIGHFTIVDPAIVTEPDLGVNFFLADDDVGKFRAERCCINLQELNPDVQGKAVTEPLEAFIAKPEALSAFNLILVALPAPPEILEVISDHASSVGTPVFYIHCLGFYSHFTIQLPHAFPIVDTHPDPTSITDLRLLGPWPELSEHVKSMIKDLEKMDDEEHGHLSYVILLLHYLESWRDAHDAKPPQTYKEKTEFREMVRQGARTGNAEGGEENFDEAVGAVLKALNPHTPGSAVKEVFAAPECQNLTKDSPDFWIIAHAIYNFFMKHFALPLPGTLPDMKAKSADYIELQNIYRNRARKDIAEVTESVRLLEKKIGRSHEVNTKEIEAFCKNAGSIKLVRGRRPHIVKPQELVSWGDHAKSSAMDLTNPESLIPLYIAFLAYDSYTASHRMQQEVGLRGGEPPDDPSVASEKIFGIAGTIIDGLIKEAGTFVEDPEYSEVKTITSKMIQELVRAGGAELHSIAAATGGIVAQEAIKVITMQYVPVDNTCLFDGINSKTSVLRL